jgi:hypothetical protein
MASLLHPFFDFDLTEADGVPEKKAERRIQEMGGAQQLLL